MTTNDNRDKKKIYPLSNAGAAFEKLITENPFGILVGVSLVAFALIACIGFLYFLYFRAPPLNISAATLGQVGDFFGGILNPALSFLSIFALLVTLVLQGRELRMSREALEISQEELKLTRAEQAKAAEALTAQNMAIRRQSFEQTFFAWLNSYHELVKSVRAVNTRRRRTESGYERDDEEIYGRSALFFWWGPSITQSIAVQLAKDTFGSDIRLRDQEYKEWTEQLPKDNKLSIFAHLERAQEASTNILKHWNRTYLKNEYQLDSLFRNLYRLILWIDSQPSEIIDNAQKWQYVSIIRAQLSWIEQVYLFYNGLTERGGKFRIFANKYALFDNLTYENDLVLEYVRDNPPNGVSYAATAFNSVQAREAMKLPKSAIDTIRSFSLAELFSGD